MTDAGSIPGSGSSLGGVHCNPLQYSCLENPTDRGDWWATVHRVTKSWTRQKRLSTAQHRWSQNYALPLRMKTTIREQRKLCKRRICIWFLTATAKLLQSGLTVWPHRQQPPGSTIPGILQARTLELVAISFSNAWKWKVKVRSLSRVWPSVTAWTAAHQAPPSMGFSRQEYWSGVPLPSLFEGYTSSKMKIRWFLNVFGLQSQG